MRLSHLIPFVVLASQAFARPGYNSAVPKSANDAYIKKLDQVTSDVLLHKTTGPEAGLDPGVVSAVIPDPNFPEFSLYWLRDACLVYDMWLNRLTVKKDLSLRPLADDIMHALVRTQHVVSLSGDMFTGGLEEPVFFYNISMILNLSYRPGSPAADGPPFRAGIMMKYAYWLIQPEQKNSTAWVAQNLWPAINIDLKWISTHWNSSSYDLWWPPIWGGSYWTAALQYRALKGGANLGRKLGQMQDVEDYDSKAALVLDYMQTFWNEKDGFMSETTDVNRQQGRTGPGSAPHTASIYNFDATLGCDAKTFQPCSDRALSNIKVVGDRFKAFWPDVSKNIPPNKPGYYGFFTEDEFLGGQPQFFATFNIAESLYDALHTWNKLGYMEVTPVSLKFFEPLVRGVKTGKYSKGSREYKVLTRAVRNYAEDVFALLAKATPKDYVLVESINKTSGEPMGPRGMIRSLTAALSAIDARGGMVQIPWDGRAPSTKQEEVYWLPEYDEPVESVFDDGSDDQDFFDANGVWSAEESALLESLSHGNEQDASCGHKEPGILESAYNRISSFSRPTLTGRRWASYYAAQAI